MLYVLTTNSLEAAVEATNGTEVVVWLKTWRNPGNLGGLTDVEDDMTAFSPFA